MYCKASYNRWFLARFQNTEIQQVKGQLNKKTHSQSRGNCVRSLNLLLFTIEIYCSTHSYGTSEEWRFCTIFCSPTVYIFWQSIVSASHLLCFQFPAKMREWKWQWTQWSGPLRRSETQSDHHYWEIRITWSLSPPKLCISLRMNRILSRTSTIWLVR